MVSCWLRFSGAKKIRNTMELFLLESVNPTLRNSKKKQIAISFFHVQNNFLQNYTVQFYGHGLHGQKFTLKTLVGSG